MDQVAIDTIVAAVDYTTVIAGIAGIAAAVAVVLVALKGAKMVLRMIN